LVPLMRTLIIATSLLTLAGMAVAAERPSGCFARTYDAGHMRDHPSQQVRRLWISLEASRNDPGKAEFGLQLWLRGKRQVWRAGGPCEPSATGWSCQPDTDGASKLLITMADGRLHLANPGRLQVFDDRTGPDLNTAHLGHPGDAAFSLLPARAAICKDPDA
jgi:hypothetical protein